MKISLDYINELLDVFIKSDNSHITINDWENAGIQIVQTDMSNKFDESFLFHLQLILENGLISNQELEGYSLEAIGIRIGAGGDIACASVPIRLTQVGHDFATALNNSDVLTKLKTELKDAPFKTIFDGSQKLLAHYFTKKLDIILAD